MVIFKAHFFKQLEKIQFEEVHQRHDKTFKEILSNKDEMSNFLKQFLGINIKKEELEEQKNDFITKHFEKKESDVIYKVKDKEIYFLIEHQSSLDKRISERILEYSLEIRRVVKKNNNAKTLMLVIPIVLYTGKRKWKIPTNFSSMQIQNSKYKKYLIKQEYELIDINKYEKQDLINKNTKISSMLLIEKTTNKEELMKILLELSSMTDSKERIKWLERIIEHILPNICRDEKEEILKIHKKEENKMNPLDEVIERINRNEEKRKRKLIKNSKKAGIMEIVKNMLLLNQDEKTIMKFTKVKKEDIEKVKKQINMQVN